MCLKFQKNKAKQKKSATKHKHKSSHSIKGKCFFSWGYNKQFIWKKYIQSSFFVWSKTQKNKKCSLYIFCRNIKKKENTMKQLKVYTEILEVTTKYSREKSNWKGTLALEIYLIKDWFWGSEKYVEVKAMHLWMKLTVLIFF